MPERNYLENRRLELLTVPSRPQPAALMREDEPEESLNELRINFDHPRSNSITSNTSFSRSMSFDSVVPADGGELPPRPAPRLTPISEESGYYTHQCFEKCCALLFILSFGSGLMAAFTSASTALGSVIMNHAPNAQEFQTDAGAMAAACSVASPFDLMAIGLLNLLLNVTENRDINGSELSFLFILFFIVNPTLGSAILYGASSAKAGVVVGCVGTVTFWGSIAVIVECVNGNARRNGF